MESELASLKDKYENSTSELESAYNKINELEANLNSVRSDLSDAQESLKLHQNNAENFRLQRDSALEIQDSLTNMIETRDTEINSLKVSIENLQQSLQSAVNSKCEMLFKNKDVHSKSITDTYKDIHSGQEKIGQNSQIEILKAELHRYMTDLQTVQGNTASLKINFERQLAKKNDELNMLNIKISKLEEIKENLNSRVNSLNKKISEQFEKEQKASDEYKNEILTKTNIIELYKSNQEDSNMKNEELTQFLSELKQLLHQSEEKNKELRYGFEKIQLEQKEAVDKKDDEISALKRELENANDLLQMTDGDFSSCLENLSPSAAIASKFIKSRMSLTQAYDQLVKLSDELELEQNEKKRLSNALTSILTELEERSPFIEQQQQQYVKVLEMKEALNEQLQTLVAENKKLREENSEAVKLSTRYKKENGQVKAENDDLSRQICYLLREIETIKGTSFPFNDTSNSKSFKMNSSDVISEKVVTFRDINELQANNQKLLKLVRNLSEKREEAEISKDQSDQMDSEEIGPKMDSLKNRITELSEAQDRQVKMINGLVRQRDMYKKMCDDREHSMSIDKHDDSLDFNTTTRSESMKNLTEKSQYFEILESQLANLKKELALENDKHKMFVEKAKSNEVKLVEMHDTVHKQFNELHSKYVKCLSSSESLSEKCKMMQIELSSSNRQMASLNEKINSYSSLIGKQESYVKKLNDELSTSRKKLVQTESVLNTLRLEHTNLINSSGNMNIHGKTVNEANCSSALKNIESIKNSIENDGNESVVKLQNALEEANRTCSTLRCMLQLEQNKYRDLTDHLKEEINQCKLKMNFEQDVMQNLKEELANMKQELKMKNNLIKELNSGFSNTEGNLKSTGVYSDPILGNLTVEHSDDVAVLKQQLEISRQHLEKYCNIYECSEKDLKTLNEAFDKYKLETEVKLQDSLIRENLLTDTCKNLDTKISTCSEEILLLQNKLNSLESNLADKNGSLEKALLDVAKLSNSVQIAEDKYAHEIVLHSTDIQALAQFKHQLLEANQKINNLEYTKTELECSLRENIESWKQCEKMLISENAETKEQLRDMNEQNAILHNQIQTLSAKLTAFNTSRAADVSADTSMSDSMMHVSDSDESKSSEQLLQIIKYLRKEKDILMTKFEIMQTENQRIKSQLESTETQLDDAKLTSKDSSSQIVSEKHSGVIRKVETLNAMSDCFVDLRKERDSLLAKVKEVSDNYNKLSETIIPIQQNNCELLAKINLMQTENDNLNKEIVKWKNRANALIEKDDSDGSDDLKKLHNEQENLLKKLSAEKINVKSLSETISKQKIEMNQLKNQTDNISKQYNLLNENYKKTLNELVNLKKDLDKTNQELADTKTNLIEKVKEIAEMNVTMVKKDEVIADIRNKEAQVRKIGKRYKTQYEELLKTVDEEKQKSATLVSEAAATSETHLETCKVFEQKTIDLERNHEEKLNDLKTQISSCTDDNKSLQKEIDSLKNSNQEKDEKIRMWHKQAKNKISLLSEAKENLMKELNDTKIKLETTEQSKDENEARLSLLKSQYDGRLAKLDKEKSVALQEKQNEIVQLNKQIESLMQKINLMQKKLDGHQTPKPSTSSNQGEKCSSETPTANIKPMAGELNKKCCNNYSFFDKLMLWILFQISGVVSQRDPNRRTSGETPLASIRPMASHTGVRTAAVLPTTAQLPTYSLPIQAPHTTGLYDFNFIYSYFYLHLYIFLYSYMNFIGSGSSDILSSPSSSHGTEYMPSSSSTSNRLHPQHPRHLTLPPPESTQVICFLCSIIIISFYNLYSIIILFRI